MSVSLPGVNHVDFTSLNPQAQSTAFFATPENRDSIAAGRTEFIPAQYRSIFHYLQRELAVDVALVQLPEPGPEQVSQGISVDFLPAVLEKAGLVTYTEGALLFDDQPSTAQLRFFANLHAHELAHQWFGNLVTMAWLDDVWLNEAFSTWIAARTVHETWPE